MCPDLFCTILQHGVDRTSLCVVRVNVFLKMLSVTVILIVMMSLTNLIRCASVSCGLVILKYRPLFFGMN